MEQHDPAPPVPEVWPPPPINTPTPTYTLPDYVSAKLLSQVVIVSTWASMAGSVFDTPSVQRALAVPPTSADVFVQLNSLVGLANGLCFLVWTHRVYKNLRALGAQGLHYTPAWAVGWFFVPLLGFYRPYQVFREIWQASDPSPEVRTSQGWQSLKPPPSLPAWWLCYTVSWIIGLIYGGLAVVYLIHNFQTLSRPGARQPYFGQSSVTITWVGWVLNIVETLLFTLVVRAITERQEGAAHSPA